MKRRSPSISPARLVALLPAATRQALAATRLEAQERPVAILAVPVSHRSALLAALDEGAYFATIDDGQEFSLVTFTANVARIPPLGCTVQIEQPFVLLRLNATLPWDTIGYGAAIFMTLAAAGVSAGFYSGYSNDYLLIGEDQMLAALKALERLIFEASEQIE